MKPADFALPIKAEIGQVQAPEDKKWHGKWMMRLTGYTEGIQSPGTVIGTWGPFDTQGEAEEAIPPKLEMVGRFADQAIQELAVTVEKAKRMGHAPTSSIH